MNNPTPSPSNLSTTVSCIAQISSIQEALLFGSIIIKEKPNNLQKPGRITSPVIYTQKSTNIASGNRKRSYRRRETELEKKFTVKIFLDSKNKLIHCLDRYDSEEAEINDGETTKTTDEEKKLPFFME